MGTFKVTNYVLATWYIITLELFVKASAGLTVKPAS